MKRLVIICFVIIFGAFNLFAQTDAIRRTEKMIGEVIERSFPDLREREIRVRTFESNSDYFRARFSFGRMFTLQKMHYFIFVNPKVFEKSAPVSGIRAIIAHELAHVSYYSNRSRFRLAGLLRLADKGFTQKFERRADLEAIARGYGPGLIEFRQWLYQNIDPGRMPEKRRNYFSPEEIELMLEALQREKDLLNKWRKNVPRNITEIAP